MNKNEKNRLFAGIIIPLFFLMIMWTVKVYEILFDENFYRYGIYPQEISNLTGIILSPFLHSDFGHLISNSIPFLFLGTALFYFYRPIALKVFIFLWLLPGLWVWMAARESYHIGASGMVYALASYLFFSGLIHKVKALIAVSFTVVFLYGDMFWGVFPILPELSWESHLFGAIVGCLSAFFFANQMPAIETSVELKKKTNDHYSLPDISDTNIHKIDYRYKENTKKKMP